MQLGPKDEIRREFTHKEARMERITVLGALPPKGHYSPAVRDGDHIYISGQLPVDQATGAHCRGTIREQARQALENFDNVLKAAGAQKNHVIKMVIFITDIALWDEVDEIYSEFFGDHYPARSIVPTGPLHYGFNIEIEGIARLSQEEKI